MAGKKRFLKINDPKINWDNSIESHYFFNPKDPSSKKLKALAGKLPFLKGHIYLFTSHLEKICLLSKSALLSSAKAVNQHLQTTKKDRWLISLPLFHVAGISIFARSFQGGFSYVGGGLNWSPKNFAKELKEKKISFCSLVPAQVYDLLKYQIKAPPSLRAVIVGGDSLSPLLYKKARELGWPLLISYGLTEASSQVACSNRLSLNKKAFPKMKLLNHVKIKKTGFQSQIKSPALLTAYFDVKKNKLYDPKDSKGWLALPDNIDLKNNFLIFKGRKEDQIKILGEKVNLQKLSFLLKKLSYKLDGEYHLLAVPDLRKGAELVLLSNDFNLLKISQLVKKFNQKVLPFEKIQAIYFLSQIEKSSLLKVQKSQLKKNLMY